MAGYFAIRLTGSTGCMGSVLLHREHHAQSNVTIYFSVIQSQYFDRMCLPLAAHMERQKVIDDHDGNKYFILAIKPS